MFLRRFRIAFPGYIRFVFHSSWEIVNQIAKVNWCYMPLVKSAYQQNNFHISQPRPVVGIHKNRCNTTALFSTQNTY